MGWHVQDLLRAAHHRGHAARTLDFRDLACGAPADHCQPFQNIEAILIRTMPAGSLEQIVFRMDALHAAVAAGIRVCNPPRAIEVCVDKYLTNVRLLQARLPVPETIVCQRSEDGLLAFDALGRDVVVKPLFGSEGRGMVRITDDDIAWRTCRAIEQIGGVLYMQRFIRHPGWDVRAFVIGNRVVAAMKRHARNDWRTNVARGGMVETVTLGENEHRLAVQAAVAVGASICGVDLMLGPAGEWYIIEVNAVPGWRALASATGRDLAAMIVDELTQNQP
jgi:ribosomal protein S6--L-glutamate ligase